MKLEINFEIKPNDDEELADIIEHLANMIRDGYIRGSGNEFDWFINKDSE
jgi:hypothetical protein